MAASFRVGLTRDILNSRGEPAFGAAALGILDRAPAIEWDYLPEVVPEITAALSVSVLPSIDCDASSAVSPSPHQAPPNSSRNVSWACPSG